MTVLDLNAKVVPMTNTKYTVTWNVTEVTTYTCELTAEELGLTPEQIAEAGGFSAALDENPDLLAEFEMPDIERFVDTTDREVESTSIA